MAEAKNALELATEAAVPNSDYETDDEGTSALAMRRREASDDDEEEEEEEEIGETEGVWEYNEDEQFSLHPEKDGEIAMNKGSGERPAEEKKDSEPFLVPTTGAFYMHDDRFRDNGGARPRRGVGTRRLWEAKDEKPWTHDMFNDQDVENEEGMRRRGRGQTRGQGRARGRGRGRGRNGNVERFPRGNGRGRGARKEAEGGEIASTSNKDTIEKEPHYVAKKQVGASSLSSSSPPFFPTGALSSLATTSRDHNQDSKKTFQAGKKLTANSSVFVPKQSQGKTQGGESSSRGQVTYGSNSFFSAPMPTKQGPKTPDYAKPRPPARQRQAQPASRVIQPTEAQDASTGNSRASSNNLGGGVAFRPRSVNDGRGGRGGKNFSYGETGRDSGPSAPQVVRPLVPYANQSQGAMVVPSMGMAMPVSGQPVYGYGSSEITWVPFVSGGGTGLGAGFMSPYVPVDGAYYQAGTHPLVNTVGRDVGSTSNSGWRPPSEAPDLSEGRQNKPQSSMPTVQSAY